jgi:uncharacterized protein
MFIDVHELEVRPIDFDEEVPPSAVDLGPEIRQTGLLTARGRAQVVEEHHAGKGKKIQDIRLAGNLRATLEVGCARCLEPVVRLVEYDFDLLYRPQGIDAGQEELPVSPSEAEIGYYSGDGLLLEDVLREQVLLALPMKTVCRDDCRGLCPQCGANLNLQACSCAPPADPHWHVLDAWKNKPE